MSALESPSLASRAAARSVADRHAQALEEVQQLVAAAYEVVEQTGSFDPKMRDILRASGLSTQAFYRHFASKDELLLVLLDEGRRQLVSYLTHQMAKAKTPEGRVRAWVTGVLAQAADPTAATRTRPFLMNQDHLAEKFPDEQRASVALLVEPLEAAIEELTGTKRGAARDATAIYHLTFGVLRQHAIDRTAPSDAEVNHVVAFALAGATGTRGG